VFLRILLPLPLSLWTPIAVRSAELPAAVPVVVAQVERRELATGQSFVGTVYPARVSDVGSAVDGRLVKLPVVAGEHVEARQPIAELLRGLLEIEREGAAAELERLRQILAELNAGTRPEDVDQARAVLRREPRALPALHLEEGASLFKFLPSQAGLVGYDPHDALPTPLNV
jgi:multidrug efflux pump subunit AcrA (membrane-fusion protein)